MQPFLVRNIIALGDSSSVDFLAYGTRTLPNMTTQNVVVTISFSQFHQQECTDDDYEVFVPTGWNSTSLSG